MDTNNPTGYAQVVEELRGGQVVRQYTYGHDLISQRQLIAGQWQLSYYGYDGHGSVRSLTDSSGAVTDTYTYDAFGTLISRTGSTPNEYLYAGERFDSETGMYYLRARYMRPDAGRFLSMDTDEGCRCTPQSQHKYAYGHDNPVSNVDPSGNNIDLASNLGTVALIGALAAVALISAVVIKTKVEQDLKNAKDCKGGYALAFYRAMTADTDGYPLVQEPASSNTLGARAGKDIPVDESGNVEPNKGGMSVTPHNVMNLRDRLPRSLGGQGNKPAFCLHIAYLPPELQVRVDPDNADHAFVEPKYKMSFATYESYITGTRTYWVKVADAFPSGY